MSGVLIFTALCGSSGTALAAPGDHIRAGEVEIIPDLDVGAEFRTNVYRSEAGPVPAANLRVAPGVTLGVASDDHSFTAGGEWQLRKFVFRGEDAVSGTVSGLDRFNEFGVAAGADLFRRSAVGLRLQEGVALTNWRADAENAELPYTSQFRNNIGGVVRLNPGPALEIAPGASWTFDSFLVPGRTGERALNSRHTYTPALDLKWLFLPRTSLLVRGTYAFNQWEQNVFTTEISDVGMDISLPNSHQVKVTAGVDGRFTEKLFVQALVGYGTAVYLDDTDPQDAPAAISGIKGLLLSAQVRYDVSKGAPDRPGTNVTVGYVRDFKDSVFTSVQDINSVFAQLDARLGPVQPVVRYELRAEGYTGDITRSDLVNRVDGDVSYWFRDWASFTLGMGWQQRASNVDNVEYDDVQGRALATFVY